MVLNYYNLTLAVDFKKINSGPFVLAGIFLVMTIIIIYHFFKTAMAKYHPREMTADYVKCTARVIAETLETETRASKYGQRSITYDEMEITYNDENGKTYHTFVNGADNDGEIEIYYNYNDPEDIKTVYEIEEADEYDGEYVYGMSMRILFGGMSIFFIILTVYLIINAVGTL